MIREMISKDFLSVHALIKETEVLDVHTPYCYWAMLNLTPNLMLVYEVGNEIIGFIAGFKNYQGLNASFIWQVGVKPKHQKQSIGNQLVGEFFMRAKDNKDESVYFTIDETNASSMRLFSKTATNIGGQLQKVGSTGTMGGLMKEETIFKINI